MGLPAPPSLCLALAWVQAFLSEVVRDDEYMNKTWELTSVWNASLRRELAQRFPSWKARPPPPPHRPWPQLFPPMVPWSLPVNWVGAVASAAYQVCCGLLCPGSHRCTASPTCRGCGWTRATRQSRPRWCASPTPSARPCDRLVSHRSHEGAIITGSLTWHGGLGAGPGYNMPTFFRIAVRPEDITKILLDSWDPLRKN